MREGERDRRWEEEMGDEETTKMGRRIVDDRGKEGKRDLDRREKTKKEKRKKK